MNTCVLLLVCFFVGWTASALEINDRSSSRDSRKLFGGYRITPRYCEPTRELSQELKGPNICMFNHECIQRSGIVVGACMDGFLFGACCQLPSGTAGELMQTQETQVQYVNAPSNTHSHSSHATSTGASNLVNSLQQEEAILPTAQENTIVQVASNEHFGISGVTHSSSPDTFVLNEANNDINGDDFKPVVEDRQTTLRVEETTHPYTPDVSPFIHISIGNSPTPGFHNPMFRPKPQKPSDADKYILVPTLNQPNKPNKTQEIDSIVNIIHMLNESSTSEHVGGTHSYSVTTTRRPPSTSYVFSASTTKRPGYKPSQSTQNKPQSSYVTPTPSRKTTKITKRTKPTKRVATTTSKKPYVSSATFRPSSTYINSINSFKATSKKPPSTSYVYSSTGSKKPASNNDNNYNYYSPSTSALPPTVIVLGPVPPSRYTTPSPNKYATLTPSKRPVTVTITNHITQNIYSTSEPSPTVLITPKPNAAVTSAHPTSFYDTSAVEVETSADDFINFPPVRNPNLNMSIPTFDENDITTPDFIEDDALNTKVESFVNKIIEGLQEPFLGLRDIVYNKNKTTFLEATTTKKPLKKQGTTKKPTAKPATSGKPPSRKPTTTKRPVSTNTTRKPTTTQKKTKPTKKIVTTTTVQNFIEDNVPGDAQDYRTHCGVRPLVKTGRIVGGKGAIFGEFPWQVLVRESTWLGLFTKNKCGGVLISNRYVMTAAHCQPGFLASLVAVFGEFDISGDLETKRSISRNVKRVIVHRQYDAATFENDLALLELEHPVQFDGHIVPICLPRDHEDFTGRMATVTGWGRLKYGGGVPSVLQEVQVPIMENSVCQEMFRTAGHSKIILESFLCAGYAHGQKDSCEGDSGGPLVLQRPDGRYQLAGTVSHGIKCAAPYLPGVYMRTTYYKPWIESITGVH